MIISASRRTDIPAFFSEWFCQRIKEQYVLVRNPMNIHQVSRIDLSPEVVDCIVFWTKNPKPMLSRLDELHDYAYYFQFTLNAYTRDIEAAVPSKNDEVIQTFLALSDKIGKKRVIWRYDPILINPHYSAEYHLKYFTRLAEMLDGKFEHCVISFIDYYKKIASALKANEIEELPSETVEMLARELSQIAKRMGFKIKTCAEKYDLSRYGIEHSKCVDDKLIERIAGGRLDLSKDKNQRVECGCVESIDIGQYNTCMHGCKYCYANYSPRSVAENFRKYDPSSPLLCSQLMEEDKITERAMRALIDRQLEL